MKTKYDIRIIGKISFGQSSSCSSICSFGKRNINSIKKIGKKTLEEFDNNLSTQTEVDNKAKDLLKFYNSNEKQVKFKIASTNLEWIKSGDIITIDYPSEHIPRESYII